MNKRELRIATAYLESKLTGGKTFNGHCKGAQPENLIQSRLNRHTVAQQAIIDYQQSSYTIEY